MEGLIPYLIHAFKDTRERNTYQAVSTTADGGPLSVSSCGGFMADDGKCYSAAGRKEEGTSRSCYHSETTQQMRHRVVAPRALAN